MVMHVSLTLSFESNNQSWTNSLPMHHDGMPSMISWITILIFEAPFLIAVCGQELGCHCDLFVSIFCQDQYGFWSYGWQPWKCRDGPILWINGVSNAFGFFPWSIEFFLDCLIFNHLVCWNFCKHLIPNEQSSVKPAWNDKNIAWAAKPSPGIIRVFNDMSFGTFLNWLVLITSLCSNENFAMITKSYIWFSIKGNALEDWF